MVAKGEVALAAKGKPMSPLERPFASIRTSTAHQDAVGKAEGVRDGGSVVDSAVVARRKALVQYSRGVRAANEFNRRICKT